MVVAFAPRSSKDSNITTEMWFGPNKDSMLKSMANGLWYVSFPAGEVCVENVDIDAKTQSISDL